MCAVSLLVLVSCSAGPSITIANRSAVTISNVVVSGTGFSNRVGTLQPGAERRLVVHPGGESSVHVAFETGGRQILSGPMGYFEGSRMYRVSLTVTTNLQVHEVTDLTRY